MSGTLPASRPVDYRLRSHLADGTWIVCVEVDPPAGFDLEESITAVERLRDAGVDCIDAGDSPMAAARMGPTLFAAAVQARTGLETVVHLTGRDRNLIALQGDLIGAHLLGVRSILAISGDQPSLGRYAKASGVWDVKADGLIELIAGLNNGRDAAGDPLGGQTEYTILAACNPGAADLEAQINAMNRKVDAGADAFFTQPCWDAAQAERFLEAAAARVKRPVIMGVMPLLSERNARFMAQNVPGVHVPDAIVERMTSAGDGARETGVAIALEFVERIRAGSAGVYLIPAVFNRFRSILEVVHALRPPA